MKKIIAILLTVALMLPTTAWACTESAVLVAKCEASITYTDASYWAETEDCILAGIKDYGEAIPRLGVQNTVSKYVAGKLDNGWMRTAGFVRTVNVDGKIVGLTKLCNVSITIYAEYIELAEMVVHNLLGEDVEVSANAIAACAMWWDGDWVSMIFHPSYSDRFVVGWVTFNSGEDVTPLYLAHFGEELRFGLACGWWIPQPEPEPAPEQTETNVTAESSATANASASANAGAYVNVNNSGTIDNSGDGCWRNNVTVQINLFSIIKQGIKILKECAE